MQRNKKIATKHRAWNKGLVIGKRDGFTRAKEGEKIWLMWYRWPS
jgi:hypothetical protein